MLDIHSHCKVTANDLHVIVMGSDSISGIGQLPVTRTIETDSSMSSLGTVPVTIREMSEGFGGSPCRQVVGSMSGLRNDTSSSPLFPTRRQTLLSRTEIPNARQRGSEECARRSVSRISR